VLSLTILHRDLDDVTLDHWDDGETKRTTLGFEQTPSHFFLFFEPRVAFPAAALVRPATAAGFLTDLGGLPRAGLDDVDGTIWIQVWLSFDKLSYNYTPTR
jgi:hypothetical protein